MIDDVDLEELRRRATCSVEEAAAILHIGRSTAYAAARDGSLPTLRISHRLLVPTAKLLVMLGCEPREASEAQTREAPRMPRGAARSL